MVVLQWNMGIFKAGEDTAVEKRRVGLLMKLLNRYKPDLIALQEAPVQAAEQFLLDAGYTTVALGTRRLVTGWKNSFWGGQVEQPIRYERASAVVLTMTTPTGGGRRVLVCNVHLPSLANYGSYGRTVNSLKLLAEELKDFRRELANSGVAEIIIGDFNLEPHAAALCDEFVLEGNRSLQYVSEQESRRPAGERLRPFYNPAWRLYGTEGAPHGSHYYASEPGGPWYVFDQAFFSGDLASEPVKVKLIDKIGRQSLLTAKVSQPDKNVGSDHLPIVWTVKIKP